MYAKEFDNQQINVVRQRITEARNIVLLSHMNADGDACGSLLGMTLLVDQCASGAQSVTPILPNGCPANFGWMPASGRILSGDTQLQLCQQRIAEADLIIGVDFNTASRIDFLQGDLINASAFKILVDHHHSPALEQFDTVVSDPDISSACELVVWLSEALWGDRYMNREVATCLYTGLRTDTGGFAFSCDQPSCFDAAAKLVAYDINPADIHNRIINTFSVNRMRFYGFAINERLRIYPEQKTALFYFSLDDQQRYGVGGEDMEGLVNYTLMMRDIEVGALLREEPSRTKVSLRSKYDVDVNLLARELGGGGHTKAAGATCNMPFAEALATVEKLLGLGGKALKSLLVIVGMASMLMFASCRDNTPIIDLSENSGTGFKDNMINANRVVIQSENTQIENYIQRHGWTMEKLPCGAFYMVTDQGSSTAIANDDRVEVHYRLEALDGTAFYTHQVDTVVVGRSQGAVALDQMLTKLCYGSKATLVAPSNSAYGVVGDGDRVAARTVVIYKIDSINKIKK